MSESLDVLVIGLGAHGSSALYHLSKTGKMVAGIDRYTPPHTHGSSHGQSRIIRQAYHESPFYVPLVQAAYPLWAELERETGKPLLLNTGGLLLGSEDAAMLQGARLSAETHGIKYEYLSHSHLLRRFPAFRPEPGTVGVWEKEAGILFPEACIQAWLAGAAANKASILCNEVVTRIIPRRDAVKVTTDKGRYSAAKVIVSAGAWLGTLLPELQLPLTIERQVVCWFRDKGHRTHFRPDNMPVYIWEYGAGKLFYGFPDLGEGIKIGFHHGGRHIRPEELQQDATAADISAIEDIAREYLAIDPEYQASSVCMYTNTPDEHFIIDAHPGYENILIASPCSGHGFKFSSIIGKILCELACDQKPEFDLSPFVITRTALR
jgi:sarcosine oxidase